MDHGDRRMQRRRRLVRAVLLGGAAFVLGVALTLAARRPVDAGLLHAACLLLFCVCGLGLVSAAIWCRFETKAKLALLTASVVGSLVVVEIGVRAVAPARAPAEIRNARMAARALRAQELGIPFDSRPLLDVVLDQRAQGVPAFPCANIETYLGENTVTANWFNFSSSRGGRSVIEIGGREVLPLGQPAKFTGVGADNENGNYVVYATDERGFRNPPGMWDLKHVEIVALGDSFAEGCEVQDDESFVARLRADYPHTINLGIGGGGPFTMLACLREYGGVLKPRIVLWCFCEENDLVDLAMRRHFPILTSYLRSDFRQNLTDLQPEMDEAIRTYLEYAVQRQLSLEQTGRQMSSNRGQRASLVETVLSYVTLKHTAVKLGIRADPALMNVALPSEQLIGDRSVALGIGRVDEQYFALFQEVLETAQEEVGSWGGQLYFVYLPSWYRVADPDFRDSAEDGAAVPRESPGTDDPRRRLLRIVRSLEIDLIDVTQAFARHPDPVSLFPFRLQGHYNPEGQKVVAAAIAETLSQSSAEAPAVETPTPDD